MVILSNEMEGPTTHVDIDVYRYSWHPLKIQGINVRRELVMIEKKWLILQGRNVKKDGF